MTVSMERTKLLTNVVGTSLLISVKPNQVIWVDFENLDVRRQKVKVLCCALYSVIGNGIPPVLLLLLF